tara:strand:+ start:1898 stop:2101 length:204 start_codon:yes stop_codon:yes gene_type:complete
MLQSELNELKELRQSPDFESPFGITLVAVKMHIERARARELVEHAIAKRILVQDLEKPWLVTFNRNV